MITIATRDFVGILADCTPFTAPDDSDVPILNAIRVEWDGAALHAMATDRIRIAWSTWNPDDEPEQDQQDDLFTEWGGDDQPWHIYIPLADAKDIIAAYKLPTKEAGVPLTVARKVDANGPQLVVERSRLTGHSAITMVVRAVSDEDGPDIGALLAASDTAVPVRELTYNAKFLADFAKVRPRGPLRLTFTGERKPTLVTIGDRFVGAIMPVREADDAA